MQRTGEERDTKTDPALDSQGKEKGRERSERMQLTRKMEGDLKKNWLNMK